MTERHTSALDHALADALHTADTVLIRVLDRDANGAPATYRAIAYSSSGAKFYSSPQTTATDALDRAMRLLRAANGDGPTRVVDLAVIKPGGAA